MVNSLARHWGLVILRGILAILFGILAFVWPAITLLTLIVIFGAYAIVDGVVAIVTGLMHTKDSPHWWIFLLEGLIDVAAGVIALILPELTALVLIYMIASWAVITGILEIVAAIRLRNEITNEWTLGLGGLVSIALGVLLFLQPAAGGITIVWTVAAYALIFGILLIILGVRLRNWRAPNFREPISSP